MDSFVESLRGNDATLDVLVNQARILTLKQEITAGPTQPLIAVGDPTILDFTVVNPRQLRITGLRIGVTDLAITTARNETYIFEVRVLADLTLIQGKLRATFPDASVKLSQLRDHFVVEGEARDPAQIARIIQTITAYLASVFIEQARTVVGRQGVPIGAGSLGGAAPGHGWPGRRPGAGGRRWTDAASRSGPRRQPGAEAPQNQSPGAAASAAAYAASPELGRAHPGRATAVAPPQIINLLRVAARSRSCSRSASPS